MPREIEAKLPLSDPAALRRRLAALGRPLVASFTEDNRFFDRPGDPLRRSDKALRLRTETPRPPGAGPATSYLTFKGPREPDPAAPGIKSRPETEAGVDDAADAAALLEALGYRQRFRFQKRRDRHEIGAAVARCRVEIDELPRLGFFVEVEGPDAPAIEAAIAALGLADAPREPRGYLTLLLDAAALDRADQSEGLSFLFG